MEAAAARVCACGHPVGGHREKGFTSTIVDGAIVNTDHPDHVVGVFFCTVEGCDCRMDTRENAFGWKVGTEVLTRRQKTGVIVAVGVDTVDVQFGGETGPVYTMKNGNVVNARQYRKGMARANAKGHGNQYLDR